MKTLSIPLILFLTLLNGNWVSARSALPDTMETSALATSAAVSVTGVSASSERVSLEMGELGLLLYATLEPANADNQTVTWSSDDTSVVVVSESGFLMPVGEGTATVTVTTDDGGFTDTIPVEVGSGWTEFTLHPDATIYYVSSSAGDDSNDGLTPETAFATINHGLTVIEGSDWLLMKRGDTFNEELSYWQNGVSAEYPTVFGAYGDLADPRPIIDPPGSYGMQLHAGSLGAPTKRPARLDNVAFVSLHLYNSKHDPNSSNFNSSSSGGWGVSILRPGNNVLFEDILSEYFGQWRLQADAVATLSNLTIRRSTIRNNWGGRAQGIFQNWLEDLTIEECLFDHNGWNVETNTLPTIFNHNLYLASEGMDTLVRRNIIARASSHGMQLRSEGIAEQNIFLGNSIGGFVSNNSITEDRGVQILNDNVVLEGDDKTLYDESNPPNSQGPRSWGIGLNYTGEKSIYYGDPLEMQHNIVANGPAVSRIDYDIVSGLSNAPYKAEGNITYNWGTSSDTIPETPFPDPDRTSGSYNATLGGDATMEAYLEKVGEQRKGNWDPDYSWIGLWSYVREGFDQTTINWRPVTGVELVGDSVLDLSVGRSLELVAEVQPYIASQPLIFWESSDENVATVSDYGTVNVVGAGTATITVMTMDGAFTDTVTLNAEALARFEDQIGATQTSTGSMSFESSWLGSFWADASWGNWVYHVGLKWVNTSLVGDASSFWLWNPTLNTWTYLHAGVYPWFWVLGSDSTDAPLWVQNSANCWVYFYAPESGPAQLYYSPGAQWINYEQRRF